ncbi:MAG: hypothetical protein HYT64_01105 [Candidatus Yanofskybacteria bacterium]|nr:hypothetical protein [Candidatus Yanofskybacteria bacterium]
MQKEKPSPISRDQEAVKKLESSKYVFRSPKNAFGSGEHVAYEWVEDSVIRKIASVEFGKDETGKDTATVKMVNPKTKNKEAIYYTTDKNQVENLKGISEGKIVEVEITDENSGE